MTFSAPRRRPRVLRVDPARLLDENAVAPGSRELVSLGTPVAGVELAIRDEAGRQLRQRKVGRIWVRGPGVMAGYRRDPAATARALRDGWLDTGDLGFLDRGELFLCGRAKDLVIVRGRNHAPQEFEESLDGLPGLRAGCSVAVGFVPVGADGEELAILAEHEPGAVPAAELSEAIRAAVLERTGVRAHTVLVLSPGTLPRTSSGKLRRGEARRRLGGGSPPAAGAAQRVAAGRGDGPLVLRLREGEAARVIDVVIVGGGPAGLAAAIARGPGGPPGAGAGAGAGPSGQGLRRGAPPARRPGACEARGPAPPRSRALRATPGDPLAAGGRLRGAACSPGKARGSGALDRPRGRPDPGRPRGRSDGALRRRGRVAPELLRAAWCCAWEPRRCGRSWWWRRTGPARGPPGSGPRPGDPGSTPASGCGATSRSTLGAPGWRCTGARRRRPT